MSEQVAKALAAALDDLGLTAEVCEPTLADNWTVEVGPLGIERITRLPNLNLEWLDLLSCYRDDLSVPPDEWIKKATVGEETVPA